ncbi:MAG: cysteine desulfurase [Alphaproteobacteria bacterium]|nr:cysteine desulfurase [Alphaproteobacteria bacterium]
MTMYDVYKIRQDFPILSMSVNGKPNTFLDSAASAQKPAQVIEKMRRMYLEEYANVHRGSYYLSEQITVAYEEARSQIHEFLNTKSDKEVVFVRNATEGINLVAASWGRKFLQAGDEVLISEAEHHANLVPWQALRDEKGINLKIFKVSDRGEYLEEEFLNSLSEKTKLVAVTGMSNVLGTVFPIKKIAEQAHKVGALVLVDACQYTVHQKVDVQDLDCDFLVFSGHKTYGPSGIGVLFGKYDILDSMPPYQYGGDMVDTVSYEKTTFNEPPFRFEAGTPAIMQAIGLGEAVKYMMSLGMEDIFKHEQELTTYTTNALNEIKGLKIIGQAKDKGGVFSFNVEGMHPQDLAFILDKEGVAVRTGHHCAQPIVNRMGYESLARASLGLYSTKEDIDALVAAIRKAQKFF